MQKLSRLLSLHLVAFTGLAFSGQTSAQTVPHFARGSAQFISPNDFVGTGRATHLGRYTEVGRVDFAPTPNPDVLAVTGAAVYTAANGNELHATIHGELNSLTGVITVTVTYVGGTGRFEDASGSAQLAGQMLGNGAASIAAAGRIRY